MKTGVIPNLSAPLGILSIGESQGTGIVLEKEIFLLAALIGHAVKKAEGLSKEKNHFTALIDPGERIEGLAKEISRLFAAEETVLSYCQKLKKQFENEADSSCFILCSGIGCSISEWNFFTP